MFDVMYDVLCIMLMCTSSQKIDARINIIHQEKNVYTQHCVYNMQTYLQIYIHIIVQDLAVHVW